MNGAALARSPPGSVLPCKTQEEH